MKSKRVAGSTIRTQWPMWMNTQETAEYLRTTSASIRNLVYRGQLKCHKPFGKLLFKRADLDRLIETS